MLMFATALDLKTLADICDDFALNNLSRLVLQDEFVEIDLKYLKFLMNSKVGDILII